MRKRNKKMERNNLYILLVGCTGVGKSTVATYLSSQFEMKYFDDPFVNNPFISKSFQKKDSLAFQSQLFFFKEFIKLHKEIAVYHKPIIQERSIFESVNIFCRLFYKTGVFSLEELEVFEDLLSELEYLFRKPDLVIYLKSASETVERRIKERNRNFENSIDKDFLNIQESLYENWINTIKEQKFSKLLVIDNTTLNVSQCNMLISDNINSILNSKNDQTFLYKSK